MTRPGIKPMTLRLIAQRLNQLHHCIPPIQRAFIPVGTAAGMRFRMSGAVPPSLTCLHGVHKLNYIHYSFYPHKTEQKLDIVVDINTKSMPKKPNSY
jgi:hypothetical protein